MIAHADVAVVGGGPSALRALADLDDALARVERDDERRRPLRVVVVEPAEPGPGAIWDRGLPEHLRMNVDAGIVDLRCASVPLDYASWAAPDTEPYPARARVGDHLAWAFRRLRSSPRLSLTHVPARVRALEPLDDGWRVDCAPAADADPTQAVTGVLAPEVLLCTGHAPGSVPDHVAVAGRVGGEAEVAVRGAALTAFDVVFDLTDGRGGTWSGPALAPAYAPSGREPGVVVLSSRTGRPMLPKPIVRDARVDAAVRRVTSGLRGRRTPDDGWWSVLADAVSVGAAAAGIRLDADAVDAVWRDVDDGADEPQGPRDVDVTDDVRCRWADDLRRAAGDVDDDPSWWWGRAWSAGYADVVASLDRGPRDRGAWERFRRRAGALERWAFGPPAVTVARLLALTEADRLRWHRVGSGPGAGGDGAMSPGAATIHTATIDAVTPGAGVLRRPRPWDASDDDTAELGASAWQEPWRDLLRRGLVTVRRGERGVLTTAEAGCLGADGSVTPGLAAVGRPTEDPVIGHDSLQRRLHPERARWAESVAERHASGGLAPAAPTTTIGTDHA